MLHISILNSYCRFGFAVEKVTPDYFEVSDSTLRNPIVHLASLWNGGIHKLRVLAEGDDWGTFLKVCMQPVGNTILKVFLMKCPICPILLSSSLVQLSYLKHCPISYIGIWFLTVSSCQG
jgi:sterol-4alpha-carboxylate 3-dehydrogenase (decarboxylating)